MQHFQTFPARIEHFQTFPARIEDVANDTFQKAEADLIARLTEAYSISGDSATAMIYIASLHAAAGLNYLSRAMATGDTPEAKCANASKETMLVAGLMAARVSIPNDVGVDVSFSPRQVIAAIEAAKLISGNNDIDKFLDSNMLECFREGCQQRNLTYGYWDYLEETGPSFDGMSASISSYTRH
jgi:hypothetical protein